jgi:dihydrofolate reductase
MKVRLIAAMDEDCSIGTGHGGLPWHLPEESAHFREVTAGQWVLLGRTTFEEMEGWFGDRKAVVITGQREYRAHTAAVLAPSVERGLQLAAEQGAAQIFVAGGGRIYREALPLVDEMVLSRVPGRWGGKVFFPEWDMRQWKLKGAKEIVRENGALPGILVEEWERVLRKI